MRSTIRAVRRFPRWRARAVAALAGATWSLTPGVAQAEEGDIRAALVWDVGLHGRDCITSERLSREVEESLGRTVFESGAAELVVRVTIRKTVEPRGWLATIRAEDARGRLWGVRELRSETASCHGLDEKLVVVTGLMADPALMTLPLEDEGWPEQQPPSMPPPERSEGVLGVDASPRPPRRRHPPRRWELELDAGVASSLGALPKSAWGTAFGVEVRFPWFGSVRLGASVFAGQTVRMLPRGQSRFRSAAAGALFCPVASQRGVARASLCGGVDLLGNWVESWEIPEPKARRRITPRNVVAFRAAGVIGRRWLVGGGSDIAVPWRRDTFTYDNAQDGRQILFRPAAFAVLVVAGAGVVFR